MSFLQNDSPLKLKYLILKTQLPGELELEADQASLDLN